MAVALLITPVLLPGNMCDGRLWRGGNGVLLKTLADKALDVPHDADLTADDTIVGMAERALAATSGSILPIGFSMGAIVALAMAQLAPERMAGLVLMGLNAGADLPERAAHRPTQQAEVRAGGLERVLIEELKPNYLAERNRGDLALLALLRDMGLSLGADVFVRQSEALRLRPDLSPMLSRLPVPVMFACGEEDRLCTPDWHARWQSMTPGSALHVVAGAGHMLPLEAPHRLADLLEVWLMELP